MEKSAKDLVHELPDKPGIYKFFDVGNTLIYVGKAKNIKKRVSNYFNKLSHLDNKTRKLVSQICNIEFTIVNTEFDALLLENNLIKSHQPKYNILLKDDKTFPYVYITRERFPRVLSTRKYEPSAGIFYGPFTSVKAMNTIVELIRKLFYLRTCTYTLSEKNIEDKKFKVCLEYHIGNCKGPCEGLVREEEYNTNIDQIQNILKGNLTYVKNYFKEKMSELSSRMEFEKAQLFKIKLDLLEKFQSTSVIVNPKITELEVYSIISNEKIAVVNFLKILNGTIHQTNTIEIKKKLDESDEEILLIAIIDIRQNLNTHSKDILSNIPLEFPQEDITVTVPQIGDKKKLLDLSIKNIRYYLSRLEDNKENKETKEARILKTLQKDLQLKDLPDHIECFDNSNIQGTNPVAAMVCYRNAKPFKKDYRHFNIKTVIGPNDFDSMFEIVHRRYKRCIDESLDLPKLIIIDGGKGQLSAACRALTGLGLYGKIPIIGIAKRLEEIFFPEDSDPLYISKKSESLKLIQQIRDETHRFAITFHRNKRSQSNLDSQLSKIPGVGENTFQKLLQKYKTISNIKNAPVEELEEIVGKKKAEIVKENLK
jgi:excinuclease ABC subunit C